MTTNITLYNNTRNIYELMRASNIASDGYFISGFILVLYILIIIQFKAYDTYVGFIMAGFLSTIVAFIFWASGLLSPIVVGFFASTIVFAIIGKSLTS